MAQDSERIGRVIQDDRLAEARPDACEAEPSNEGLEFGFHVIPLSHLFA